MVTNHCTLKVKATEHCSSFVSKEINESPRKMSFHSRKKNISATFSGNLGKFAKVHLAHLVALVRFANLIHCLQLNATSRATRMNLYQK